MGEQMTAIARLEGGMRFEARAGSGQHVALDAAVQSGGTGASCARTSIRR
jgi:hypothetical protein